MTPAAIRPFAKADLEPSYGVWRRAWAAAVPSLDMDALEPGWRRQLPAEYLPARIVLAAECDRALAGFAIFDPARAWLDQLVVDPARHRAGIGRALMAAIRDLEAGPIEFRVMQANAGAIAFYERLGCVRLRPDASPTTGWPSWRYVWPAGRG
ncbi:GNAT family N-acetyltransferase [Prosthecomicrobium hirschii]|uniref:GNAT family N-acetyltransferase n=1 Tax=Prosthecodimorpha hirschii TaxID=665126 RepID=UPI002220D8BE|nr:GNAT family N-acetyltransferase [Prosthecomicrobium hirschii]